MCDWCDGNDRVTKCPQCGVTILGATPEDWREHFEEECEPLGVLYCFTTGKEAGRS